MFNSENNNEKKNLKRFLLEVIIFSLMLISPAIMIDEFLTKNLKTYPKGDSFIWGQIFGGNVNSEIVIYGASRALQHFEPKIMEDSLGMTVYNLGIRGHNFWIQYLRHLMLLKHSGKPGVIVQELSLSIFSKRKDLYDPDQFLPIMLNQPQVESFISSYEGYTYLDFHMPLLRYYGKPESMLRATRQFFQPGLVKPDRFKGYLGDDSVWRGDWNRSKLNYKPQKMPIDLETVKVFEFFLQSCRDLGIKVIFVSTPEFVEAQDYLENRKEIFSIINKMSSKYNIPFLDYSNDLISYQREYFYNSAHLNSRGAEIFTKKFVVDLKPLLVR